MHLLGILLFLPRSFTARIGDLLPITGYRNLRFFMTYYENCNFFHERLHDFFSDHLPNFAIFSAIFVEIHYCFPASTTEICDSFQCFFAEIRDIFLDLFQYSRLFSKIICQNSRLFP